MVLSPSGIPTGSSVFVCFLICVKGKLPRLLRNEVPDNVPEYSGPFCCLNKLSFVFPDSTCEACLVKHLTCPTCFRLPLSVDNVVLKATCSLSGYKYLPPHPSAGVKNMFCSCRLAFQSPPCCLCQLPLLSLLGYCRCVVF